MGPLVADIEPIITNCDFWPLGPYGQAVQASWVLGSSLFGLQLFLLIISIIFEPNNYNIIAFQAVGFMWVRFGLLNSAKIL